MTSTFTMRAVRTGAPLRHERTPLCYNSRAPIRRRGDDQTPLQPTRRGAEAEGVGVGAGAGVAGVDQVINVGRLGGS